jgi:hypothetical protein
MERVSPGESDGVTVSAIIETAGRHDVDAANFVLLCLTKDTQIHRRYNGWYVTWSQYDGRRFSRRWATRSGSFYPSWYRHWGHGGTCTTALAQLVRWCQGKPVLPLSVWSYWVSPTVALGRENGDKIVQRLFEAGYPVVATCVLCGTELTKSLDWWDLDGVSGPSCKWGGCRQRKEG